jgi:hypothetical protein
MTIGLIIRGHERDVFLNDRLYNFVKRLTELFDTEIYIHTWNKSIGSISWRDMSHYKIREIDERQIREYFKKIAIKKILIDDETKITLVGTQTGNVCSGPCPRLSWKRMWYGKYRIIEYVKNKNKTFYDLVLNIRFDLFENINNIYEETEILEKVQKLATFKAVNQIYFLKDQPCAGIDNCYIGNQTVMFFLTENFHNKLDEVESRYVHNFYTEYLVYFEAMKLNYHIWLTILEQTPNVTFIRLE